MDIYWSSKDNKDVEGLGNTDYKIYSKDKVNSFIREMIQNSNDAKNKNLDPNKYPLEIKIRMIELDKASFPEYEIYSEILDRIKSFHSEIGKSQFFKNIDAEKEEKKVRLLVIEDYNTIGLIGEDEDYKSNYYSLVKGDYLSAKQSSTAGGSHGIGKNAIVGLSKSRTVFFSSRNLFDENIFIGFSKLGTYTVGEQRKDKKIYYSIEDDKAIRDLSALPVHVKRVFERKEPGLSQFVVWPRLDGKWRDAMCFSIIQNQWKLILDGNLEVVIENLEGENVTIGRNNLQALMEKFHDPKTYNNRSTPQGYAYDYYDCIKNGKLIEKDLGKFGKLRFHYKETVHGKSKYVSILRNGLVIKTERFHGYANIKYCGVIYCDGPLGNEIMRDMENPEHDDFNPENLHELDGEFSIEEGKLLLEEIHNLIKEGLDDILKKYMGKGGEEEWLDNFFGTALGEKGSKGNKRTGNSTDKETAQRVGKKLEMTLNFKSHSENSSVVHEGGEEYGAGPSRRRGKRKEVRNKNKTPKKNKIRIQKRIWLVDSDTEKHSNTYQLKLNSENTYEGLDVLIKQKADSGEESSFELLKVTDVTGNEFRASRRAEGGNLIGFRINDLKSPGIYRLEVKEPYKSSFKIS
ncbi:MAG: hypothetical protein BalsKO_28480 [Balneolaceae bacterium]